MNTYEEAKRLFAELSLENIALKSQLNRFKARETKADKKKDEASAKETEEEGKAGLGLQPGDEEETFEARVKQAVALVLKNSPALLHFFTIVVTCYLWGRWGFPFWLIIIVAVPWLEIIKTTESERLANNLVIERYLRRLLLVDDDQYAIGDTAAWLNRAMVRLWPSALEPMISSAILENIQFIFDDFLQTQSIIKRLTVESVSLGEVPIRIKRIRTSLPEDNLAATKAKASKGASKKFEDMTKDSFQEKQHMSFDYLLQAFQECSTTTRVDIDLDIQFVPSENMRFEISAGLHKKLPFYLHISKLSLEGTVRLRLSNLMGIAPHVGMLGITLPTLPDLDFQIRPMSKLPGDITQMPLVNQIGDLVRTSLTVLALPNVLEIPLAEMSKEPLDEEAAAVKIVNVDSGDGVMSTTGSDGEPRAKIDIEVLRAFNLASADSNFIGEDTSDPFVVLTCAHHKAKTKVKKRTCNPTWNEQFGFMVQNLERSVKFSVYDHDIIGKNTLLGTAVLDPEALYDPNGHPSDPPRRVDLPLSSIEYGDRGTLQVTIKILDLGLNLNAEEEEEEGEASEEEDWGGEAEDETMAEREEQAPAEAPPAPEAKDLVELLEEKWTEEEALCPKSAPGTKASSDGSLPGKVTLTPQKISKPSSARDSPKSVKRESSLFSADDVQAALKDDPGTPTGGADVAPSQPHVKRTLSRGLSRQMSSLGTFKGRAMTRGGWMRTAFKERYVVLANDQLIVYKDTTCTKEFFTNRISSQMDIIGLGRIAQGFPVHIQDSGKILFEMWLDSDEERQRLTKALDFCVKQR